MRDGLGERGLAGEKKQSSIRNILSYLQCRGFTVYSKPKPGPFLPALYHGKIITRLSPPLRSNVIYAGPANGVCYIISHDIMCYASSPFQPSFLAHA